MTAPTSVPIAIVQNDTICLSSSVTPSASAIPIAAIRLPDLAVAGELSLFSPKMKRTAATMKLSAITEARTSSILLLRVSLCHRLALLEHLEHAVRHHEAAENVGGAKDHGDEAKRLEQRRVRRPGHQHRAEHDDSVDRVRARHERRVQHGRNSADDFEADENRHDEDVDAEHKLLAHFADSTVDGCSCGIPSRSRVGVCRISPSAVTQTALMMSSPKFRLSSPLGASRTTNAAMFLAYIWLAWNARSLEM